ncbi:MAG: 3-methyladenine DNA glycosylase [Icmadophila ericetorum]|nr:3-methyladenine DNA glycosylase [Icmadophila ericetorum]
MSVRRVTRSSTQTAENVPESIAEAKAELRISTSKKDGVTAKSKRANPSISSAPAAKRVKQASEKKNGETTKPRKTTKSPKTPKSTKESNVKYATPPPPSIPVDRPADPHTTNAPLKTPKGSTLITYTKEVIDSTPSKHPSIPKPTTTTANLLKTACAHLVSVEPKLAPLIAKHECRIFTEAGLAETVDPFNALASSIISQQVSGAAAKSIRRKFIGLFDLPETQAEDGEDAEDHDLHSVKAFPTPSAVASKDLTYLRTAGLSGRKAEYIKDLAAKFASGELSAQMLISASYDELLEKLIAVRGLGKWSVEMFACFGLKRMDIFSTGDLGVQKGMAEFVGRNVKGLKAKGGGKWKYMSEKEMLEISEKFAPYRSLFMWYMWRVGDVEVEALEGGK